MDTSPTVNFREEFSAKIPALTLLMTLGYTYLMPAQCLALRDPKGNLQAYSTTESTSQVMLLPVLREFLAKQTFPFEGKQHHLSDASIDKIVHQLTPALNQGLSTANEIIYDALLYGIGNERQWQESQTTLRTTCYRL